MSFFDVMNLLGGLAMFLYGMSLLSDKLEKIAGGKLEKIFEKITSNRFKGLFLGIVITAVVQSSTATTVMLVGFVNSGLMRLSQAISVIMGANIGTTVTTWILSLSGLDGDNFIIQLIKPVNLSPAILLIGVIMRMMSKHDRKKDIGGILVGFALLMLGMGTMTESVAPLQDDPKFASMLMVFTNPVMGLIVGAVVTAILHSSAASIGMLQALSTSTRQFTFGMALPILLGQNIGTCVTALFSSIGANKNAKRVAVVHLYFNVIGAVVMMILYYGLDAIFDFAFADQTINGFSIAVVHTVFNLVTTALLLPFTSLLEKLAYMTIKDDPNEFRVEMPVVLDDRLLNTPGIAIEQTRSVTNRMASISKNTISLAIDLLKSYDDDKAQMVLMDEDCVDRYEDSIGSYLVKLSGRSLMQEDNKKVSMMLHAIGDFERISDHAVNILDSAKEIYEKNIGFSQSAKRELDVLFRALEDILDLTVRAFSEQDLSIARKIEPLEEVVDALCAEMKNRHIIRLQEKTCTIEQGFIFTDLLTNVERVSDHCSNIAVNLIQISENSFDNHQYLNELKKEDNEEFVRKFDEYSIKYLLPKI
ncbi:MAG: Na/Pi cotransporter family protein [Oscillospiraceae bacterium]|nr:Na/Pi cotransporter family protein [Oscillospiraceae bacterium]